MYNTRMRVLRVCVQREIDREREILDCSFVAIDFVFHRRHTDFHRKQRVYNNDRIIIIIIIIIIVIVIVTKTGGLFGAAHHKRPSVRARLPVRPSLVPRPHVDPRIVRGRVDGNRTV